MADVLDNSFKPLAFALFLLITIATLAISVYFSRRVRTAGHYYVAGGGVKWFVNGIAFAGDYLSAASFLGVAGMIAFSGYDGFMYGIGFLAGWIVALFLIAEPLRVMGKYTFADALVQARGTRRFGFDEAFSLRRYADKLNGSLLHTLNILKWCIPLAAVGGYVYLQKDTDVSSLMGQLGDLGRWSANMVWGVSSFVNGLFGKAAPEEKLGGMMEGILVLGVFIAFLFMFFALAKDNLFGPRDMEWINKSSDMLKGNKAAMPPAGKYNAGQKGVFWVMAICLLLLLVTGLLFWQQWFADSVPIPLQRAAVVIHAISAFIISLVVVMHIYAALWVKGTVRAMTQGTVSAGWAKQNHYLWYKKVTGQGADKR